jgi:hypothetical protein
MLFFLIKGDIMTTRLASPLATSHTSSMSYRLWYQSNNTLKHKETHWGTAEEMDAYIEIFDVLRIDHKVADTKEWVTVWQTKQVS